MICGLGFSLNVNSPDPHKLCPASESHQRHHSLNWCINTHKHNTMHTIHTLVVIRFVSIDIFYKSPKKKKQYKMNTNLISNSLANIPNKSDSKIVAQQTHLFSTMYTQRQACNWKIRRCKSKITSLSASYRNSKIFVCTILSFSSFFFLLFYSLCSIGRSRSNKLNLWLLAATGIK